MLRARLLVAVTWATSLLWALCLSTRAEEGLAGAHALDDGMQRVREHLRVGECKKGIADLQALLEKHAQKNYAKARRAEIEQLMRELACGVEFRRPRPKDLVDGILMKWAPSTGKFRIKWTPDTIADLELREGLLSLPVRLTGPFTLEIRGRAYASTEQDVPRVVFGGDPHPDTGKDQTWRIEFGVPAKPAGRREFRVTATITHADGAEERTLSSKCGSPGKLGMPYKVVVVADDRKISLSLNNRAFGRVKKPAGMYGYLSFRAGAWTEAKLETHIEPSWIQSRVDDALQAQLDEFDKTYDPTAFLPGWLAEPPRAAETEGAASAGDPLTALKGRFASALEAVDDAVGAGEFDHALRRIDEMQAAGAGKAACAYLRAEVRQRMRQLQAALGHANRCVELAPDFLDGLLLQGALLRRLGRGDEARSSLQRATEAHPRSPRAYEEALWTMLADGRTEDAQHFARLAARNGVTSVVLVDLKGALAKALDGPRWRTKYQHRSRNYHVVSDIDQETCAQAARLLEETFDAYRTRVPWKPRDWVRLFRVYVFSSEDRLDAYLGELAGFLGKPAGMDAGFYSPLLRQLLVLRVPDRSAMWNAFRREGFHQYIDRLMPSPPVWLDAGLAAYFENAARAGRKLVFDKRLPEYVWQLNLRGLTPLETFLYAGPAEIYDEDERGRGQAWLLVHMLQHSTPAYRTLFQNLVTDLRTQSADEVQQRLLPPANLPKVEDDLRAHLEKLASER